jgi:hypothetical protein
MASLYQSFIHTLLFFVFFSLFLFSDIPIIPLLQKSKNYPSLHRLFFSSLAKHNPMANKKIATIDPKTPDLCTHMQTKNVVLEMYKLAQPLVKQIIVMFLFIFAH